MDAGAEHCDYINNLLAFEFQECTDRSCTTCKRPANVCICSALPEARVRLRGKLVVLQHPHEVKRRLASVPLLELCLEECLVLRTRTYRDGPADELGAVLHAARAAGCPLYVLFPAEASQNLARACVEAHQRIARSEQSQQQCEWAYVLLAIDGTWRQGREMYRKLLPVLEGWAPRVVHLPPAAAPGPAERACLIKREPCDGCVMTAEAVARALGLLEGSAEVQEALLAPLRRMTGLQAAFDPAVAARLVHGNETTPRGGSTFGFRMPAALRPGAAEPAAACG